MEILFPKNIECIYCRAPISRKNKYSLCKKCYNKIEKLELNNTQYDNIVLKIYNEFRNNQKFLSRIFLIFEYNDIIKSIIHRLKYQNATYYAHFFGEIIYDYIQENNIAFDYIMPVPSHKDRIYKRGYNQVQLITDYLNHNYGYEIYSKIVRKKNTPDMYHLDRNERDTIMKDSFFMDSDDSITGKQILIIDDILTTGSTLINLIKEIEKKNKNVELKVLVISRPSNK